MIPLANRMRPRTLDGMVGQRHILGGDGLLRRIAGSGTVPNLLFYGPPGVGKTTAARILAEGSGKKPAFLNGTTASTGDIRDLIRGAGGFDAPGGILLHLDEIQYLNRKQQQTLLEQIETGAVTLIASTTENPFFTVYGGILSRCTVFEFRPVPAADIEILLNRAFRTLREDCPELTAEEGVIACLAANAGGDVRKALNALEICALAASATEGKPRLTLADARLAGRRGAVRCDRDGDEHYDLLSALHKSVRGSDPDAALHYLARLLEAGDLISPCRRLLCAASEDIGLAEPIAVAVVKACVDSAFQLGLPEARLPLAEAAVYLATLPKSDSVRRAIDAAGKDVRAGKGIGFPRALQNVHCDGAGETEEHPRYISPHDRPGNLTGQQYLPEDLKDVRYYVHSGNRREQAAKAYWDARRDGRETSRRPSGRPDREN